MHRTGSDTLFLVEHQRFLARGTGIFGGSTGGTGGLAGPTSQRLGGIHIGTSWTSTYMALELVGKLVVETSDTLILIRATMVAGGLAIELHTLGSEVVAGIAQGTSIYTRTFIYTLCRVNTQITTSPSGTTLTLNRTSHTSIA